MPPDNEKPNDSGDRLQYLRKELYARDESEDLRRRQEELSKWGYLKPPTGPGEEQGEVRFKNVELELAQRRKKRIRLATILGSCLLIIALIVAGTWWYRSTKRVTDEMIAVSVDAPSSITSGQNIQYTIHYKNESKVGWQNVELVVELPTNFEFRDSEPRTIVQGRQLTHQIGTLSQEQEGEVRINGQLVGEAGSAAALEAELFLTPENFLSGRFSKKVVFTTAITTSPVEVAITAPGTVTENERRVIPIQIRNLSNQVLQNVSVRLTPSPSIEIMVTDPLVSPDFDKASSQWLIPTLAPFETVTRTVVVTFHGKPGSQDAFAIEAALEQEKGRVIQHTITHVFSIAVPALSLTQTYNEKSGDLVVSAEEKLEGVIHYRNTSQVNIRDLIISLKLDGIGFDPEELDLKNGAYDSATQTIRWSAATVPALKFVAPGQEGDLEYSFSMLPTEKFPTTGPQLTNFLVVSTVSADSPDLPPGTDGKRTVISNRTVLSTKTNLTLTPEAFYDDGRLGLPSSGPNPPQVNQETTYTVRLRLGSTLNDTSRTKVEAVIPDGVRYTGKEYHTLGDVHVNERTGLISWEISLLPAGTGRIAPPAELHVQLAVRPGEDKGGNNIQLLRSLTVSGIDEFVDQVVTLQVKTFPRTPTVAKP